jgi:hypothetical protein
MKGITVENGESRQELENLRADRHVNDDSRGGSLGQVSQRKAGTKPGMQAGRQAEAAGSGKKKGRSIPASWL